MQLRKVQEMGGATLLVSLPKEWAKSLSVEKGTILSIESSGDGGLLLYPVKGTGSDHPEKEVEIEYPSKFASGGLSNQITAAYLLGYDLIRVKGKRRISPKDREQIIASFKSLIGLEVVEEDALSISSQFLVDNTAVEPSRIFKRISNLVRSMISDTLKQFSSGESPQLETISRRDDEIDRLHFLLVRLIRTAVREPRAAGKFGMSAIDCLDYRVAASSLETAGDYSVELADSISKMKGVGNRIENIAEELRILLDSIQDEACRSFIGKDFTLAREVLSNYEKLETKLEKLESDPLKNLDVLHFAEIIGRISRCQRDIVDLVSPMNPA